MTTPRPRFFWSIVTLGTAQAALAGSMLFDTSCLWWIVAAAYPLWLRRLLRREAGRSLAGFLATGYVAPLLTFALFEAAVLLPARPESAEASALFSSKPAVAPADKSHDVPAPKLVPTRANRELTRGVWLLGSTFIYLAACAAGTLLWHTPVVVYIAAFLVAVFDLHLPE